MKKSGRETSKIVNKKRSVKDCKIQIKPRISLLKKDKKKHKECSYIDKEDSGKQKHPSYNLQMDLLHAQRLKEVSMGL